MTAPSPSQFAHDLNHSVAQMRRLALVIGHLYAELHDPAHDLGRHGADKVANGSHSTPTESIVLSKRRARRALEDVHKRIQTTPEEWRALVGKLERAMAHIEDGLEDDSAWSVEDMRRVEQRARSRAHLPPQHLGGA